MNGPIVLPLLQLSCEQFVWFIPKFEIGLFSKYEGSGNIFQKYSIEMEFEGRDFIMHFQHLIFEFVLPTATVLNCCVSFVKIERR